MPIAEDQRSNILTIVADLFNANPGQKMPTEWSQTVNSGSDAQDGAGGITEYVYDTDGELVSVTGPDNTAGSVATDGSVASDGIAEFGAIEELAPDAGIFELDLTIPYTDGPTDAQAPETLTFEPAAEEGTVAGQDDTGLSILPETSGQPETSAYATSSNTVLTVIEPDPNMGLAVGGGIAYANGRCVISTSTVGASMSTIGPSGSETSVPASDAGSGGTLYSGFPNGRRAGDDTSEPASDAFIFSPTVLPVVQQAALDLVPNAPAATTEPGRFGETYPDDLSGGSQATGSETASSVAIHDDLIL